MVAGYIQAGFTTCPEAHGRGLVDEDAVMAEIGGGDSPHLGAHLAG